MAIVLSVSVLMMALLLSAVIWQSGVISYQREVIRDFWSTEFGR
jgi:hypothetical protein